MFKRALVLMACVTALACGSSPSPTGPSSTPTPLSSPTSFLITHQEVTMTSNLISLSWSGGASTYKVFAGTTAGGSDLLAGADVTGTTYTWTAPRTAGIPYVRVAGTSGGQTGSPSTELPVFTIDMRNVIDALFFSAGPMSESPTINPGNAFAAMWPDGVTVNVLVTNESGSFSLDAARTFITDYLSATSNFIGLTLDTTSSDYHGTPNSAIPQNTVIVRVFVVCGGLNTLACANYGPAPVGPGNSFVNLNFVPTPTTNNGLSAISHEIGHSFGLHHLVQNASARPEFRFLMNPQLVSSQLSDVEKTAIASGTCRWHPGQLAAQRRPGCGARSAIHRYDISLRAVARTGLALAVVDAGMLGWISVHSGDFA